MRDPGRRNLSPAGRFRVSQLLSKRRHLARHTHGRGKSNEVVRGGVCEREEEKETEPVGQRMATKGVGRLEGWGKWRRDGVFSGVAVLTSRRISNARRKQFGEKPMAELRDDVPETGLDERGSGGDSWGRRFPSTHTQKQQTVGGSFRCRPNHKKAAGSSSLKEGALQPLPKYMSC